MSTSSTKEPAAKHPAPVQEEKKKPNKEPDVELFSISDLLKMVTGIEQPKLIKWKHSAEFLAYVAEREQAILLGEESMDPRIEHQIAMRNALHKEWIQWADCLLLFDLEDEARNFQPFDSDSKDLQFREGQCFRHAFWNLTKVYPQRGLKLKLVIGCLGLGKDKIKWAGNPEWTNYEDYLTDLFEGHCWLEHIETGVIYDWVQRCWPIHARIYGSSIDFNGDEIIEGLTKEDLAKKGLHYAKASDEINEKLFRIMLKTARGSLVKEPKKEPCVLCAEPIIGFGNNPAPVTNKGQCCDDCNLKYVIPARVSAAKKEPKKETPVSWKYVKQLDGDDLKLYNSALPIVYKVTFNISRYGEYTKTIRFDSGVTVRDAVAAAEAYLSIPVDLPHFSMVRKDLWDEDMEWDGLLRGHLLTDSKFLEVLSYQPVTGGLTLDCGS